MGRKKSDYMRILEMGEWLETFLQTDLEPWRYRELAVEAIKQLNLTYNISEKDLSLRCIEKVESQKRETKKIYINELTHSFYSYGHIEDFIKERDDTCGILSFPREIGEELRTEFEVEKKNFLKHVGHLVQKKLKTANDVFGLSKEEPKGIYLRQYVTYLVRSEEVVNAGKKDKEIQTVAASFYEAAERCVNYERYGTEIFIEMTAPYTLKYDVVSLLKSFYDSNGPWWERYKLDKKVSSEDKSRNDRCFYGLKRAYSDLVDSISINNGPPSIIRKIQRPNEESTVKPKIFPWIVVISRIMFDFLLCGGQDYYGFCEHCGKFFLIQRRGRKKYCSDVCRATAAKTRNLSR